MATGLRPAGAALRAGVGAGADGAVAALMVRAAEIVAAAGGAALSARRPHDGALGGSHASARRGGGVEFAEHRDYARGDDLRHLDWRAFGRSDRLLVKRFETEVHSELHLVVDGSASMGFADDALGRGVDKLDEVRLLAAALATLAVGAGDAVRLSVPGQVELPARSGRPGLLAVLSALVELRAAGDDEASGLAALPRARGAVPATLIALSDVLAPPALALASLAAWRRAGADVLLVQTLHPLELDFDFPDAVALRCAELERDVVHDPRRLRREAVEMMAAHVEATRQAAVAAGLRHLELTLGGDRAAALRGLLRALASAGRRA